MARRPLLHSAQEVTVRNPFRSEAEAFRFTLIVVGLGVVVALAGVFGGGWTALGVFLGLVGGGDHVWC